MVRVRPCRRIALCMVLLTLVSNHDSVSRSFSSNIGTCDARSSFPAHDGCNPLVSYQRCTSDSVATLSDTALSREAL
jgi:hypothetical protein